MCANSGPSFEKQTAKERYVHMYTPENLSANKSSGKKKFVGEEDEAITTTTSPTSTRKSPPPPGLPLPPVLPVEQQAPDEGRAGNRASEEVETNVRLLCVFGCRSFFRMKHERRCLRQKRVK